MSAMKHSYTIAQELVAAQTEYDEYVQLNTVDGIAISREADIMRGQLWNKVADLDTQLTEIAGWEWRCRVLNAVVLNAYVNRELV